MVLDNKKTAIKVYLWKMIQACVMVLFLIGIMVTGWFEKDLLGITKYQWVILVSLVYLILVIVSRLRKLNFFYFSFGFFSRAFSIFPGLLQLLFLLFYLTIDVRTFSFVGFNVFQQVQYLSFDL